MSKPLILIDGSSWLFRAYFGLPSLTNSQGEPTGAVYGFASMLKRLHKDYAPERLCVVFDPKGKTLRDDIYPQYKATRSETPEDLSAQFPRVIELIAALGLPCITVQGVEADDVIGTLAREGEAAGLDVLIVTGDKDMAQLVNERIKLLDTMKNKLLDAAAVQEKFGVPPGLIRDYLALMGDTSDNIPGVPKVGPVTAAKWLNLYGSLDAVVAHAAEVSGKVGESLRASLDILPLSKNLTTIRCDIALPVKVQDLKPREADKEKLAELYQRFGFNRWYEEIKTNSPLPPGGGAVTVPERSEVGADGAAPARVPAPALRDTVSHAQAGAQAPGEGLRSVEAPVPHPSPSPDGRGENVLPPSAKTQYETVLDEAALARLVAELQSAPLVCVDTETDNIDSNQARLVGLSFATRTGHGWYVPVGHDYLGAPAQLPLQKVLDALRPVLEDPAKPKLGQHIKYDLNVLMRHGVQVGGVAHDTMLQSYVLDAAGNRHDMDTLALKYLNHSTIAFSDVAGKGKAQLTFNQVSIEKAAEYSAEDADITLRLHEAMIPRLDAIPELRKVYETIEMPLVPVLASIEQTGVKVDVALLRKISGELAVRMAELQALAFKEAAQEFNLGSPKQLGDILYNKLQLPVLGKTPKGEPSTAEDVLEQLAEQHPLPRLILDWRAMQKLRSTYTEQLPLAVNPKTGRIHTSYGQAIAATGRLSSSDPNLQNIPVKSAEGRRIRQAFVAAPGNLLCSIDYSQIELRLMAHLSGDARLIEAFIAGRDIHQATAAEVFGLTLEQVGSEQRRAAKAINFGLIYGMSAFGLAKQLGIERGQASDYIERFFGRYPGVKQFMERTKETARKNGYVETLFGRRLYLPNILSKNQAQRQYAERTAINAPLQGTAADLIKLAMIDIGAYLAEMAADVRMIMQVHDELVFEGPAALLQKLVPELAGRMCRIAPLAVPLVADFGFAGDWDAAHVASGHASSAST